MNPPFELPESAPKALFERATMLGFIVMEFASLEFNVDMWIASLLGVDANSARAVIDTAGQLKNRCELVIKLAHTREMPDQETRDNLVSLLEKAQREFLPKRNRLVHDVWILSEKNDPTSYKQYDTRIMLKRPASRQPKAPTEVVEHLRTAEDMSRFCDDLALLVNQIANALYKHNFWIERSSGRPQQHPQRPKRPMAPHLRGKQGR